MGPVRHRGRRPREPGGGDARCRCHIPERHRQRPGRKAGPRGGPRWQRYRAVRGAPMTGEPSTTEPLMILVAGPYRSGTDGDPQRIAANVAAMTEASLALYRRGHLPVMGEWFALPLIEEATRAGDGGDAFEEVFHPVAERLLDRCDACLGIVGRSEGADRMGAPARRLGKTVFTDVAQIP